MMENKPYWFDMDGNPIDIWKAERLLADIKSRRVALTSIHPEGGTEAAIEVSTVLLVLDHSMGGSNPEIFETLVSNPEDQEIIRRYSAYQEAVEGHDAIVAALAGGFEVSPAIESVEDS